MPAHIHAKYGEYEALIHIRTSDLFKGSLPIKKLRIVQNWLNEGNRRITVENNFYELNPHLAPAEWNEMRMNKLKKNRKP